MIANKCFSKEWITRRRGEMGSVDPALLEKSIHAFALLCALSESPMPFVFKGGTSMILLLKVCGLGLRGMPRDKHAEILADGISKISSHLVNTRFRLEEAKISASRAALLAALLKIQPKGYSFKEFLWSPKRTSELPSLMLKPPLENLNRIKALIPEAFYNFYTAQELLK